MFRKIVFGIIFSLLSFSVGWGYGIVNNSGTTGADGISIPFFALDSAGNVKAMVSGDSVFFNVYKPDGALAYRDSLAYNGAKITSQTVSDYIEYTWKEAVGNIDGASPTQGAYSYILIVNDQTSAALATPHKGHFQLINSDFDDLLDSAAFAQKANAEVVNIDAWNPASGIVQANTAQISGDAAAADSLEKMLDGTRATLFLSQLSIVADGNKSAIAATGSGTGSAINATGGANGGHGIYAHSSGAGGGDGAVFYGGAENGNGLTLASSGTGKDLLLSISGNISDGINHILKNNDSVLIDVSSNLAYADTIANRTLEDSLHYKGGTVTVDSASVARAVWNAQQANHTLNGTFGKYLDAEISGLASGGGGYSFQIFAFDSSIGQVIPGVGISIRNLNQSALIAAGATGVLGAASFNLDNESYLTIASSPGYIFENYDTIVVTGIGADTVFGYQFNPGAPSDPSLCRVYGYLFDLEGNPEADAIIAGWLPAGASRLGTTIVSPFRVETESDEDGYFYLDLIPSSDLTPATCKYEITITLGDGTVLRERILVPDSSNWQLIW